MAGAVDVPESQILPWWDSPAQEAPEAEVPLRLFNFSSEHSTSQSTPGTKELHNPFSLQEGRKAKLPRAGRRWEREGEGAERRNNTWRMQRGNPAGR